MHNRRTFLRYSGALATLSSIHGFGQHAAVAADAAAQKDFPRPCPPGAWKKHGVILEPDQPWEENEIQAFLSTIEPLDNDRWRIWYGANHPRTGYIGLALAEGRVGEKMTKTRAVLSEGEPEDAPFAIGNIPKGWRLALPTHLRLKDGRHRLYFFVTGRAGGQDVQRYLAADSADGRRYRVLDPERPSLYTFWDTTPNKKFLPGQKLEDIVTNDGATVYQLPDGTFEMYAQSLVPLPEGDPRRVAYDNIPNSYRVIDRLTSDDGIKFDHRDRKVLTADAADPIDTQFYHLSVTHTPRGRVGLLGWYRVKDGFTEMHYVVSSDGIKWNRVRQPWLERGKPGQPDSMALYPPSSMIFRNNQWWLFYTGVNYTHSTIKAAQPNETQRSVIMLATTPSLFAS